MAITAFPGGGLHVPPFLHGSTSGAAFATAQLLLNASGDKIAYVIEVPRDGALHSFEAMTSAMANVPDNGLRYSFQDIDVATGFPDGTQDQFRDITSGIAATTWLSPPGPITSDGTDLGTKRTVTKGQRVGCVIEFVSFVASDSISFLVHNDPFTMNNQCYVGDASSGTYASTVRSAPFALRYDDGYEALFHPWLPWSSQTAVAVNTGTTPDEIGLRFQVAVPLRVSGALVRADVDGPADVILYDASNNVLATGNLDQDVRGTTSGQDHRVTFDESPELSAATTYRVVVKPTSGTSLTVYELTLPSSSHQTCLWGGAQWYSTSRADAGAWTDDNTKRVQIGLVFDGFDNGAGGGGGGGEVSTPFIGFFA